MKKLLLVLVVSLAVMGCGEFYYAVGVVAPNFNSATGNDRGLLVANETQENLVAFHGSVARENLIGGIRATESNHYFSLNVKENPNPGAFNHTHDFVLVLVKNEDYKTYFFNLNEAPVFAQIYVTYNKDTVSTYKYTISKNLGGKGKLIINNMSEMDADLRLNGINGVSIGYAPAQHKNTEIQLEPDTDYELYVVFRRYSPKLKETVTYYPTKTVASDEIPVYYTFKIGDSEVIIDLMKDFVQIDPTNYSFDYAYLQVNNGFNNGVEIRNGMSVLATANGTKFINSGDNYSFQLNLAKSGSSVTAPEQEFAALQIVSGPLYKPVDKITMKAGYIYPLNISTGPDGGIVYEWQAEYAIDLGDIFAE